jgi:pSer/pThr/pTyr-binding forkhead associated (FHA) protein/RNA polymerase subunit RPABC4/transcription elongation factor Spt4
MICARCGEAVHEGNSFCQYCGASTVAPAVPRPSVPCGHCGGINPPGTNFCQTCGLRLAEPPVAPAQLALRGASPARSAARLVAVKRDGSDGPSFPVTSDQFDIGRTEGDLLFDDAHMASRHARLSYSHGQFLLAPLETRNGVYLQVDQPVELNDGDHVLLGKQVLRFEVPTETERNLRPALEHGVVLFGTPLKPAWGRLRQVTAAGTTRDVYHLTRGEVVLGREQGDVVFADDEFLSRRHAQLQQRNGRVLLQDLGSSNGTFIRLRGQHPLAGGALIRMGDELLRFEIG